MWVDPRIPALGRVQDPAQKGQPDKQLSEAAAWGSTYTFPTQAHQPAYPGSQARCLPARRQIDLLPPPPELPRGPLRRDVRAVGPLGAGVWLRLAPWNDLNPRGQEASTTQSCQRALGAEPDREGGLRDYVVRPAQRGLGRTLALWEADRCLGHRVLESPEAGSHWVTKLNKLSAVGRLKIKPDGSPWGHRGTGYREYGVSPSPPTLRPVSQCIPRGPVRWPSPRDSRDLMEAGHGEQRPRQGLQSAQKTRAGWK